MRCLWSKLCNIGALQQHVNKLERSIADYKPLIEKVGTGSPVPMTAEPTPPSGRVILDFEV